MSTIKLFLWKYNQATGYWVIAREVTPENAQEWYLVFQKDEPKENFEIGERKPKHKPKWLIGQTVETTLGFGKIVGREIATNYKGKQWEEKVSTGRWEVELDNPENWSLSFDYDGKKRNPCFWSSELKNP